MVTRAFLIVLSAAGMALAADPPAIQVQLSHPDRQLERLIGLFEGSKAHDPAAALSAWKRAPHGPKTLSKATEAAIALLNPSMVRELRTLEGAEFVLRFDEAGAPRWSATVPEDDGTFAALATAMALSGGGAEGPSGAASVDRLGPPGSALLAQSGKSVVVAGRRDDLETALGRLHHRPWVGPSGLLFGLNYKALDEPGSLPRRRIALALRALHMHEIYGDLGLDGETLALNVGGTVVGKQFAPKPLDPSWLDWVPADRTVAAVAVTFDPDPDVWDLVFRVADRVEKVDPARADFAPIRTRVNLAALAVGIRPDVDLWPHLLGLTAFATANEARNIDGALLALHLDAEPAATRLLPRLVRVAGKSLHVARRGSTLLIAWGDESLKGALDARDHPEHSAGRSLRASWDVQSPDRAGALWPGRLFEGLAGAEPVSWRGMGAESTRDEFRWPGLRGVVRRFLDRLPMETGEIPK